MRRSWRLMFAAVVVGLALGTSWIWPLESLQAGDAAKPGRPRQRKGRVEFLAIADLSYSLAEPALIGARPADPKKFQASLYALSSEGACTSTLVGRGVLLTAAHCVADGGTIGITLRSTTWEGVCTHAPGYATNDTADWALCSIQAGGPTVPYERLSTDPKLLRLGDAIQLTGFGCTQQGGGGGNDGIYRVGEAPVRRLPDGNDNDVITTAGTALCFGDSGGPAFRYTMPGDSRRTLVGVNSRGNIRDTSYLSSTSTKQAVDFFMTWANQHNLKICGLHANAEGCHE